jgi:dethiobiotin synthetase
MSSLPPEFIKSSWKGEVNVNRILKFRASQTSYSVVGLFLVYGSWNASIIARQESGIIQMIDDLITSHKRGDTQYITGKIKVDCQETEEKYFGETLPCPPERLPAVLVLLHRKSMKVPLYFYLSSLKSPEILNLLRNSSISLSQDAKEEFHQALASHGMLHSISYPNLSIKDSSHAIRIFVAGDRMSVGKTSVCLGILGNLVAAGYPCESLAYIKPATQNENPQLVQKYCERMGIACVPIGPIVYYRGFTRAFLAGDTESPSQLLAKVQVEVDKLAVGRHVVLIDGVGFPAVGSICGTDNATVARTCGYPKSDGQRIPVGAILVGGPGVGSAVDAFNLNASYFERTQVPVLGALFNKLSLHGFYSLANCKQQIESYFEQYATDQGRQAFGFVPLHSGIASSSGEARLNDFIRVFGQHVNVQKILTAAQRVRDNQRAISTPVERMDISPPSNVSNIPSAAKRQKLEYGAFIPRSREEIEGSAIRAGATTSE